MNQTDRELWINKFNSHMREARRLSYPVRERSLIALGGQTLESFLDDLNSKRLESRASGSSDDANFYLSLVHYVLSLCELLSMWDSLGAHLAEDAWDFLVGSQEHARAAMRAHGQCRESAISHLEYLQALESILFPPQQFVSASFVVMSSDCSICGKPFHECDHVSGIAYHGQFCSEIIREAASIDHIALVDDPHDKRCRTTHFVDDGRRINSFTLAHEPNEEEAQDRTAEMILMTSSAQKQFTWHRSSVKVGDEATPKPSD